MGPDLLKQDKNQAMEVVNLIKVKIYRRVKVISWANGIK